MRSRGRKPLAVAAAGLLAGVGAAVVVATPAVAAEYCGHKVVTILVNSTGTWSGTDGNDVVLITASATYDPKKGSDLICITAAGGATVLAFGNGNNIAGGPGPDTLYGSSGDDYIAGGGGDDVIKGNNGNDRLDGFAGNDYIRGNAGDDVIGGGTGDDCLLGGSGYNQLYGDAGNDIILMGYENRYSATQCAPADWDYGAAAQAFRNNLSNGGGVAEGHNDADRIWGSNGTDYISGGAHNDVVYAWGGADFLSGDCGLCTGSDVLHGGAGNDSLAGYEDSSGVDYLFGDSGTDSFTGDSDDVCYPDYGPETVACD